MSKNHIAPSLLQAHCPLPKAIGHRWNVVGWWLVWKLSLKHTTAQGTFPAGWKQRTRQDISTHEKVMAGPGRLLSAERSANRNGDKQAVCRRIGDRKRMLKLLLASSTVTRSVQQGMRTNQAEHGGWPPPYTRSLYPAWTYSHTSSIGELFTGCSEPCITKSNESEHAGWHRSARRLISRVGNARAAWIIKPNDCIAFWALFFWLCWWALL